mmetsp:Transcript_56615/g.133314  ORF Transcript_56615/g.133314 Transcript_56615/m.133314 type:complete len:349 (-) Transcript_56615:24-1070(-)
MADTSAQQQKEQYLLRAKELESYIHYSPKDDKYLIECGSTYLHISMLCEEQTEKKKYVDQSIGLLEKALQANPDSKNSSGESARFCVSNALYFGFLLEEDDAKADAMLTKAKSAIDLAVKKDGTEQAVQMKEHLKHAQEQRTFCQSQLKNLKGKSEMEKQIEIRKMHANMVEQELQTTRTHLEKDPTNVNLQLDLARHLFDVAMVREREDAIEILEEALETVQKIVAKRDNPVARNCNTRLVHAAILKAMGYALVADGVEKKYVDMANKIWEDIERSEEEPLRSDLRSKWEIATATLTQWKEWIDSGAIPSARKRKGGNGALLLVLGIAVAGGVLWWYSKNKEAPRRG